MSDYIYILLILGLFVVGMIAQGSVQAVFRRYSEVKASSGITAANAASGLLNQFGARTTLSSVGGRLTDHYDPRNDTVGLSQSVFSSDSVAALAVAAHEIGHVKQYYDNYAPIKIRNAVLPAASFASQAAPWIAILGLFMGILQLVWLGAILYGVIFLFQLVTLPVEFNASRRGIDMLISGGYISHEQEAGAAKVLRAAAMTYVVSTLMSLLYFLRFWSLANRSSRR